MYMPINDTRVENLGWDDYQSITVPSDRLPRDGQCKKSIPEPYRNSEGPNQYLTVVHHNTPP